MSVRDEMNAHIRALYAQGYLKGDEANRLLSISDDHELAVILDAKPKQSAGPGISTTTPPSSPIDFYKD
jgi:hypothetical protein